LKEEKGGKGFRSMIASLIERWQDALRVFPVFRRQLVAFQVAFALVAGALLSPALAWLLEQLIRSTGDYAVSNYDLIGFLLSFKGLSFLAGSASVAAALLYLELTGLLLITADVDRPVRAMPVLRYGLRRFPELLRLGLLQVLGLALAAAPFALGLVVVKLALLGAHDINYFLYERPPEWTRALVISGALGLVGGAVLLLLALRWLFALPILLSSDVLPWKALQQSWRLSRGHLLRVAGTLGGWWLAAFVVGGLATGVLRWFAGILLGWAGLRPALVFLLVVGFLTLLLAVALSVSIVTKGVNALLINRLFRAITGRAVEAPHHLETTLSGQPAPLAIRRVWLTLLFGFIGMALAGIYQVRHLDFGENVVITAHRGSSLQAPENTLSALRGAIADGADYAEIDVQTTRDGFVVLLHDRDFMRLAGDRRRLEDLTLAETRSIDLGVRFDAAFAGERLATLAEAIDLVRGQLRLNIELKYNRPDPGLVPAVVDLLRQKEFLGECVITSLDLASLREVKRIEPGLETGMVVTQSVGNPARLPVDFLSVNTAAAGAGLLSAAQRAGKAVHVWTVNDTLTMTRMIEAGVDNVITDRPAEMRFLLQERGKLTPGEKLALQMRRRLVN
jgi:glycerophosphoryl diester phosphodiesterase